MYKYVLIFLILFPLSSFSQVNLTFQKADSLSYQYYLRGDWNNLIKLTKEAFKQDLDSKFMRQRAGYAYFMTRDYFAAKCQYEKALTFDQSDNITREYLYYSALNTGSMSSRFYAGNLPYDAITRLGVRKFNPIESVDTEFNLKTNQMKSRSNPDYYRIGLNSELGYRLSLYQAYSYYEQTISGEVTRQPEYLALLKWVPSPFWQIKIAYHRLFTNVGNTNYPANLGLIALSSQLSRFSFEANASVLKSSTTTTQQMGVQAGVVLPGRPNIYLTGSVVEMHENGAYRTIYAQTAGFKCSRNLWAEGNITVGNLKNYNTFSSLYVYNAVDPSVFRTGLSMFYFTGKHITLFGNFTLDQKGIENLAVNGNYYQYSYSVGIKWKL